MHSRPVHSSIFFFNDTATTEIYTLSLHDALPILDRHVLAGGAADRELGGARGTAHEQEAEQKQGLFFRHRRSEEHTSELQSHSDLVCRLLLEKKICLIHNI